MSSSILPGPSSLLLRWAGGAAAVAFIAAVVWATAGLAAMLGADLVVDLRRIVESASSWFAAA